MKGYYNINREAMETFRSGATKFCVWGYLSWKAHIHTRHVETTCSEIASFWGIDKRQVHRCLQTFEEEGMIVWQKGAKDHSKSKITLAKEWFPSQCEGVTVSVTLPVTLPVTVVDSVNDENNSDKMTLESSCVTVPATVLVTENVPNKKRIKEKKIILTCPFPEVVQEDLSILADVWNGMAESIPGMPQVRKNKLLAASQKTKRMMNIRKIFAGNSKEEILTVIDNVSKSLFLTGRKPAGDGNCWRCDLDWVMEETHFERILSGYYNK